MRISDWSSDVCSSDLIAAELFDTGVNMGPQVPVGFLQRALNAFNREQRDYADIVVDRQIGPKTMSALNAFLRLRTPGGETVLMKAMEALQGERYLSLAERRPANEAFLYGWMARSDEHTSELQSLMRTTY